MDPVLESYFAAEKNGRERNLASLQEQTAGVGMLGHLQDQQSKRDQMQREAAWRAQLHPGMSPDQLISLGMTSGAIGPKDVVSLTQQAQLKRESDAAKKQIAMDRLNAATQQKAETIAIGWKNAKTAEEKSMWQKAHAQLQDTWSKTRLEIEAGNSEYNTGTHYSVPALPSAGPMAAPAAPAPAAPAPGAPAPPDVMAGIGALNAAEPAARAAGQDMLQREAQPNNGGMLPASAVIPPRPDISGGIQDAMSRQVAGGAMTRAPLTPATPMPAAAAPAPAAAPLTPNTPMPGAVTPPAPLTPATLINGKPRSQRSLERVADATDIAAGKATAGGASAKAPESVVDAIAEGRQAMPTGFASRSPYWIDVIERVHAKDPSFDAGTFSVRTAARKTFAAGPEARNVTALNTVIGHLGTLDELAGALESKNTRAENFVRNRLADQLNKGSLGDFRIARLAVAEEIMRVFRGNVGASESEAKQWANTIRDSGSPEMLRSNVQTIGKLLEARVNEIANQYDRAVNQKGNPAQISDKSRTALDRLSKPREAPSAPVAPAGDYSKLWR